MKGITKLFVSRSLKSPMAKKNKKRSQPENKLSKPKSKRLKPEEDPSTVKRCLLEDPPTKKRSPQPLENPPTTESSGDDEEMATEEEGHESCSSSEEEEQKDAGKNYPTKKNYFQRKWSEDDEIILLQSMVDFKNDIGKSPYDDMIGFIDTVKNIISFQANQNQFTTKIRRLKEKYVRKRNKSADENSFANAHDLKCFQLSKVIWESTKVKEESLKPNEEKVGDWFVNSSFVGLIASFGVGVDVVKQRWSMVSMKTKKELEEKFKLLIDKESEYLWLKTSFFHEVNSMITEAY